MPKCERARCGFEGPVEDFKGSLDFYHDMQCPKCHTSAIDTTDVFDEWAKVYGYGKNNTLVTNGGG